MTKMMGKIHDRNCDCNCTAVSGINEKCNREHGVKRQRAREKRKLLIEEVGDDIDFWSYDSHPQFEGERCIECGVNVYDASMYDISCNPDREPFDWTTESK